MRRRRALVWVAAWFVALRALIPIGFMLSVGASGAAVTLCPDYAPTPLALATEAAAGAAAKAAAGPHHGHHHAHAGHEAQPGSTDLQLADAGDHGLCPFAAAAHLGWHGPQPTFGPVALDLRPAFNSAAADVAVPRLHLSFSRSPRGPPALNLG